MFKILRDWITKGTKPSQFEVSDMLSGQLTQDGISGRAESLKSTVVEIRNQYKNAWESYKDVTWSKLPETWEIKDDIDIAFEDIVNYVSNKGKAILD